jgi:hypothetical protein
MNSVHKFSKYEYQGYYHKSGFLKYIVNDTYYCQCFLHTEDIDTLVYMTDLKFHMIDQVTVMTEPFTEIHSEIIRKFFPNMKTLIDLDQQRVDIVKNLTRKIIQRIIDRENYKVLSSILPEDIIEMLVTINNP